MPREGRASSHAALQHGGTAGSPTFAGDDTIFGDTVVRKLPVAAALKEAAVSALAAFGLFFFLIGLRTDQGPTGALVISTRFDTLALLVGAVFVGALIRALAFGRGAVPFGRVMPPALGAAVQGLGRFAAPALLAFALLVPVLFYSNRYLLDVGILVLTYVMLGWGLNIVVGLAGLLDLGYVAFYAVGAYSYALLAQNFGLSFWICLPLAGCLAAFWGILLGFPVLRLRGDYLAIVTLAFGEIIRLVLLNWQSLTGGPNGISGVPRPSFFGLPFSEDESGFAAFFGISFSPTHRVVFLFYLILALALLTNWVTLRLRRLPIGRAWEALREDEIACRSLGINTTNTKLTAFAMGAMFGGFAGAFFATRQGFISPESFTFSESALVLAIVVLGGMGSQLGVAVAALAMLGGFELFRGLDQYRMLVFGFAMVIIMIVRPRGLVGSRTPSLRLAERKSVGSDLVGQGRA
jgi:branched-chain amino acid transport system permease protein